MNLKYYIILPVVWVCFCFPSGAFGQYIKKRLSMAKIMPLFIRKDWQERPNGTWDSK